MGRDLFWVGARGIMVRPWLIVNGQFRHAIKQRLRLILGQPELQREEPELPTPTMSLVGIGVAASARGQKIGLSLMQAFEARTHEARMRSLRLSVYPHNIPARRLYEKCGWQPFEGRRGTEEAMYYFKLL